MGCNISRPWKRPLTPIYEPLEMPKTAPVKRPKLPEIHQIKPILYKCENCGANLVQGESSWYCEYCGTRYGIDLGQKEMTACTLYSDNKAVYTAYQDFGQVAHDLSVPKLPIITSVKPLE